MYTVPKNAERQIDARSRVIRLNLVLFLSPEAKIRSIGLVRHPSSKISILKFKAVKTPRNDLFLEYQPVQRRSTHR